MLVGNQEEAALIHEWYHYSRSGSWNLPEGWTRLGEGSFRAAYLSPSGVVYKVQKDLLHGYQTNHGEYEKWRDLYFNCKMPQHSRLPKLGYFPIDEGVGVVAIERLTKQYDYWAKVPGTEIYWGTIVDRVHWACKVGDLGGDNLFMDDDEKTVIPVDLADTW